MTNIQKLYGTMSAAIFALLYVALVPVSAYAAPAPNAFLGGGNALSRATSGESRGLTNASPQSNLIEHLTFASTQGGRPEEVPPPKDDSSDEESGEDDTESASSPGSASGGNSNANGNASGGNGGSGGGAQAGGLVRAGSVVSNSNALNVINTNIVRISSR